MRGILRNSRKSNRGFLFALVLALAAGFVVAMAPGAALADTAPTPPEPATVSVDALPTAQVDGVVWSQVVVGNTVYVGGNFANARPAGAAPGVNTTPRSHLLAYDVRTGELISSFAPTLNGQVLGMSASPDGTRLYIVGDFTAVNGSNRYRIASFNTATGALVTSFAPGINARARAVFATNTTVYAGGSFTAVSGLARTRLAAMQVSNGAVLNWAPAATPSSTPGDSGQVMSVLLSPDNTKLIVGGQFSVLNGVSALGMGAVDPESGANVSWNIQNVIYGAGKSAGIYSLTLSNGIVYGTGYTFGPGGNVEGTFAVNPSTGDLKWIADCHGDHYSAFAMNGAVYSVGHAHHCDNVRGFPQTNPWTFHRALAFSEDATSTTLPDNAGYWSHPGKPAPTPLNWYPDVQAGSFTGQTQAAWSISANSDYLVLGGEFPAVNGIAQQGLVRFARKELAPNKTGPELGASGYVPTLTSPATGIVRGSITANYDYDNENLTYNFMREGLASPIYTANVKSVFYKRPTVSFVDKTATPGQTYRYRVHVVDPYGNSAWGDYASVTAATSGTITNYGLKVLEDNASLYYRLGEASGNVAKDWSGTADGVVLSGVTRGADGAIVGDADKASTFSGTSTGLVRTPAAQVGPSQFAFETWIKTTTTRGGKIIGFGSSQTGSSSSYDRHVYMLNNGKLTFGVYPGGVRTVSSAQSYNDGQWHHVVASLGGSGMQMYVDGALVAADATVTTAQAYNGYWRIGGDNLGSWPNAPTSLYFAGVIDDVAIYSTPLSPAQISSHYSLSGRGPNTPPTASFTSTANDLTASFDGSASSDPDGSIIGYAWDFGDSSNGTGATATASHTYATGDTYHVTLTVTDNRGGTNSVTKDVTVSSADAGTVARDDFERTVVSGWGTAGKGGAWTQTGGASAFSVNGGKGQIAVAAGATRTATLAAVSTTSTDTTVSVSLNRPVVGSAYVSVIGRRIDATNDYRVKLRYFENGDVNATLIRVVAGTETTITAIRVPGLVFNSGDTLRVRLQVSGTGPTALKAKVWKATDAEPAGWTVTGTDATAALQAAGSMGLQVYIAGTVTNAPITVAFDDLLSVLVSP